MPTTDAEIVQATGNLHDEIRDALCGQAQDIFDNPTQFMQRMVECADRNALEVVLVYYPPYHSTYTPIERCWGILEEHWNGTLLDTVDTVLQWARTMTWKAIRPIVQLLDNVYANGIRVAKKAFRKIEERLERHASLPKYCVRIQPQGG